MSKKWIGAALFLVTVPLSFGLGVRWGQDWGLARLKAEVTATLWLRLEALANLRLERPEEAIKVLEQMTDTAVASLGSDLGTGSGDEDLRQLLLVARAYRQLYPQPGDQVPPQSPLKGVPDLSRRSPGLRDLLTQGSERAAKPKPPQQ